MLLNKRFQNVALNGQYSNSSSVLAGVPQASILKDDYFITFSYIHK